MKKLLVITFAILFSFTISAQDEVVSTDLFNSSSYDLKVYSIESTVYLTIPIKKNGLTISKYDLETLSEKAKFENQDIAKGMNDLGIHAINNDSRFFYHYYSKSTKSSIIAFRTINNSCELEEEVVLKQTDGKTKNIMMGISLDSNSVFIHYISKKLEEECEKGGVIIINKATGKSSVNEYLMPYSVPNLKTLEMFVNDNTPNFLVKKTKSDKGQLCIFKLNDESFNEETIGNYKCFNYSSYKKVIITKVDENIVLSGLYNPINGTKTKNSANTAFVLKVTINESKESFYKEYPLFNNNDIMNLGISKVILNDDNSIVIVGEQSFALRSDVGAYYHYYNIFLVKIDEDGNKKWQQTIPKMHRFMNSYDNGDYALILKDEQYTFVFNDHKDNLNSSSSKKTSMYIGDLRVVNSYNINIEDGSMTNGLFLDDIKMGSKRVKFNPDISTTITLKDGSVVFISFVKNNESVFVRAK